MKIQPHLSIAGGQSEQVAQEKEAERLATQLADTLDYNPSEDAPFSILTADLTLPSGYVTSKDAEQLGPYQIALSAGTNPQEQGAALAERFGIGGTRLADVATSPQAEFGEEHGVWFDEDSGRVIKATRGGRFGKAKSPAQYLAGLILRNKLFGDDVRFLGAIQDEAGAVTLFTDQPIYEGDFATPSEIEGYFRSLGYVRTGLDTFYNGEMVVGDANSKNVIKSSDGLFHAFDVQVSEPRQMDVERLDSICNASEAGFSALPRNVASDPADTQGPDSIPASEEGEL